MTKEFKVGDEVKCLSYNFMHIKHGEILTVTEVAGNGWVYFVGRTASYNPERFELVSANNGVDGNNNPVEFTVDSLKPFQRVVFQNGDTGVVGYEQDGRGVCICITGKHPSWVEAYLDPTVLSYYTSPYLITEVYAPPHVNRAMTATERGELVFSRKDFAAEERAAKLVEAEAKIAEAEAQLAAARAAKAAI